MSNAVAPPYWVQKTDPQPTDGENPNHVAIDATAIHVNYQHYRLYAAIDPSTNRLLHIRLFPTRTTALTQMVLAELREKHLVSDAAFLVDGAPWLQALITISASDFSMLPTGIGTRLQGTETPDKRLFQPLQTRELETAETWLQASQFAGTS